MLGPQHEAVGTIVGAVIFIFCWLLGHPFVGLFCLLITIWGANIPDFIDPPFSPYHRSIGHSFVSLGLFFIVFVISFILAILFNAIFWPLAALFLFTFAFSAGFLSHLICDLTTPMGLPLFFGKSILGVILIPGYLVPIVNVILFCVTLAFGLISIVYIAKKIGGKVAMLILFIPLWGLFFIFGIALFFNGFPGFGILCFILTFFTVCVLLFIGHLMDIAFKSVGNWLNNRQMYKALKNAYNSLSTRKITTRRGPILAAIMSYFIPGLGQFYNGETFKAIKYFMIYIFILIAACVLYIILIPESGGISLICCLPLFILPILFWFYVIFDSFWTARKINKKIQL